MNDLYISKERIEELAEKEIIRYVDHVLNSFHREGYSRTDHFDPRMQKIVEREISNILNSEKSMTDINAIVKDCFSDMFLKKLSEIMIDQLRETIRDTRAD